MKSGFPYPRYAAFILCIALLASLAVAYFRLRVESQSRRVEIAMDYNDFVQLAHSFDYNPTAFLVALRRAGLTSLALTEELGTNASDSGNVNVMTGTQLLDAARLAPITDPTLSQLVQSGRVKPDVIYLTIYDPLTYERYRAMLPLHFEKKSIRIVHATKPWVIALRSQIDYFNTISLGIPDDQLALARKLHLDVIPRFQNDERMDAAQIANLFGSLHGDRRVSTVIFFGLGNQVVGFPDHVKDTAALFKAHRYNFGSIEIYDPSQTQKGAKELAQLIPGQTVRVEAIPKLELDKLKFNEVIARYELGVRERNVRVVYLRPFAHEFQKLSIEATNVELVKTLTGQLRDDGFTFGRATPIPLYRGNDRILIGIAALGVPSIFLLLLALFAWYRVWVAIAAYGATIFLYGAGLVLHHEMFSRSVIALAGALLFASAAFLAISTAFREHPRRGAGEQLGESLRWTLIATGVSLLGALIVVGLMSSPLAMEEIEPFRGVKLVLLAPPLIALVLYVFTKWYGAYDESSKHQTSEVFLAPVRVYHLLVLGIVGVAGVLLWMRSGNQSDIAPSTLELSLRHGLTHILNVRPRFKEFLLGFPLLMLTPALVPAHRRAVGWLLALGIGVGIGDVIDTFSHLHTPLLISLLRIFNGLVLGAIIGFIAILIYRACVRVRG